MESAYKKVWMSVSDDITEFKRSGSPYRKDLNVALLTLNEEGILTKLKFKWWMVVVPALRLLFSFRIFFVKLSQA